jgi:hypothetical protein
VQQRKLKLEELTHLELLKKVQAKEAKRQKLNELKENEIK